jgi:Fur family transcriptional regulator, peroxide stress response regulator
MVINNMINQDTLIFSLRHAGLRITPQRMAICKMLVESFTHPTASEIYEHIIVFYPSLSLATVYNTLDVLVAQGKVNVLGDAGDGKVHFDANIEPHINLACVNCHKIVDVSSSFVAQMNTEITESSGYNLLGSRVFYYGICPACQGLS